MIAFAEIVLALHRMVMLAQKPLFSERYAWHAVVRFGMARCGMAVVQPFLTNPLGFESLILSSYRLLLSPFSLRCSCSGEHTEGNSKTQSKREARGEAESRERHSDRQHRHIIPTLIISMPCSSYACAAPASINHFR